MSSYQDACNAAHLALTGAGMTQTQAAAVVSALECLIEQAAEQKLAAVLGSAQQSAAQPASSTA